MGITRLWRYEFFCHIYVFNTIILMQKKTLAISLIIAAIALIVACKKNSTKTVTGGNVAHALTDSFYYRAKVDTTWFYHGDSSKDECIPSSGGVCSSFLYDATFTLSDSANPHPHDSIIRSWVGKTFAAKTNSGSKAYAFSFTKQDTLYRQISTDNVNDGGSFLTINSVTPNGVTAYNLDSAHHGYKCYKIKGTFNANVSLFNDTLITRLSQGDFSINVVESTRP